MLRRLAATVSAGVLIASSVALTPSALADDEPIGPPTNTQIIEDWYLNFLQRLPDDGAPRPVKYWLSNLPEHTPTADLLCLAKSAGASNTTTAN